MAAFTRNFSLAKVSYCTEGNNKKMSRRKKEHETRYICSSYIKRSLLNVPSVKNKLIIVRRATMNDTGAIVRCGKNGTSMLLNVEYLFRNCYRSISEYLGIFDRQWFDGCYFRKTLSKARRIITRGKVTEPRGQLFSDSYLYCTIFGTLSRKISLLTKVRRFWDFSMKKCAQLLYYFHEWSGLFRGDVRLSST